MPGAVFSKTRFAMVLSVDGFNHPLSLLEGDGTAANDRQVLLSNSEIDTISPVVAY